MAVVLDPVGLDTSDSGTFGKKGSALVAGLPVNAVDQTFYDAAKEATALTDNEMATEALMAKARNMFMRYESEAIAFANIVRSGWTRSYNSFRNKHFDQSKYHSPEYARRSKIFRPKTRSSVRRAMQNAATALFANTDVVRIEAEDESDSQKAAAAELKQQIINYRLSRSTDRNAIPWFLIAMGSVQDAKITGLCISKQSWVYKERKWTEQQPDQVYGGVLVKGAIEEKTERVKDRPDIHLFPPENVLMDPMADWTNPAQRARYLILRYGNMDNQAILDMVNGSDDQFPWLDITEDVLKGWSNPAPSDTQGARSARTGGRDPQQQASAATPAWLAEVFMNIDGEDMVWWQLGSNMLSSPTPTRNAYPHLFGERPVVIGYGAVETHNIAPMSSVESSHQLQMEMNDLANTRLDAMKQSLHPLAKVKRGKNVDIRAIMRRGPNSLVYVQDQEDVAFEANPQIPQAAFVETNYLNADFDDLMGAFNSGSVQTNRSLNETVGGMRLLSGSADQMSEFDLTTWAKTWAEPVIAQILRLEEYYEDDARIILIAGKRAQLWQRFGIDQVTDDLLMSEASCRMNIGVGATTLPMEKLQRFAMAGDIAMKMLSPFVQGGQVKIIPKAQEIVDTIFSTAGFQDGGKRFFESIEVDPNAAPPGAEGQAMDAKLEAAKLDLQKQKIEGDHALKRDQIAAQRDGLALKAGLEDAKARKADDDWDWDRVKEEERDARTHAQQSTSQFDSLMMELARNALMPSADKPGSSANGAR